MMKKKFLFHVAAIIFMALFAQCATDEKPAGNVNETPVSNAQPVSDAPMVTPNFGGTQPDASAPALTTSAAQPAPVATPAVNTNIPNYEKFAHFICPKACKGSGSEVYGGKCPVCGTAYVHNENSEGHREEMTRVASVNAGKIQLQFTDTAFMVEKPKNYEKVAHYICAKGCKDSGSENPGKCPTCGTEYAHNDNSLHHEMENNLKLKKH